MRHCVHKFLAWLQEPSGTETKVPKAQPYLDGKPERNNSMVVDSLIRFHCGKRSQAARPYMVKTELFEL